MPTRRSSEKARSRTRRSSKSSRNRGGAGKPRRFRGRKTLRRWAEAARRRFGRTRVVSKTHRSPAASGTRRSSAARHSRPPSPRARSPRGSASSSSSSSEADEGYRLRMMGALGLSPFGEELRAAAGDSWSSDEDDGGDPEGPAHWPLPERSARKPRQKWRRPRRYY